MLFFPRREKLKKYYSKRKNVDGTQSCRLWYGKSHLYLCVRLALCASSRHHEHVTDHCGVVVVAILLCLVVHFIYLLFFFSDFCRYRFYLNGKIAERRWNNMEKEKRHTRMKDFWP